MLISFAVFLLLFFSIYLLTPHINTTVYQIALILTRSKNFSLGILIAFLLPGTIIHELSHFIIATLLFVPTGSFSILPKIEQGRIKAGSLKHADTDPIRRTLIGIAPMLVGLCIIYMVGSLVLNPPAGEQISNVAFLFFVFYFLFIISISMFSSRKDLEVAVFVIPIFILLFVLFFLHGLTVSFSEDAAQKIGNVFSQLDTYLLITLAIDTAVYLTSKMLIFFLQKILRIKVVPVS